MNELATQQRRVFQQAGTFLALSNLIAEFVPHAEDV